MASSRSRLISKKRMALFSTLFVWQPPPPDKPGPYVAKLRHESMRPIAELTWPDHGVCMKCMSRGIAGGQCKTCGHEPKCGLTPPSMAGAYGPIVKAAAGRLGLKLNKACTEVIGTAPAFIS